MGNRPSVQDRHENLGDRMANRGDWQNDRQDWRDQNREDWQNWADDKHDHYGDWYHDSWHPGAGWGYMWDNYPVASALGLTAWGINRIGYGWGYWDYSNPYVSSGGGGYGYDYSQPLVYADSYAAEAASGAGPTDIPSSSQQQPTDEGLVAFEAAREAFRIGDYAGALAKLDTTLKTMPNDTVVHEFRSLVLFSLNKYPEAAAAIYAVLAAGPGWDWTTMISLYPSAEVYTEQLRALENFVKANPMSADAHFLLGYHYQTMGHDSAAAKQFRLALDLLPNDKLIKQLVGMTSPPGSSTSNSTPPAPPSVPATRGLQTEQLVGNWKASNQGAAFELNLDKNGSYIWTYAEGKRKQTVKGVFAVDQNNLALETDDGGETMLAEVKFTSPSQFQFKMIGDDDKSSGLKFTKSP